MTRYVAKEDTVWLDSSNRIDLGWAIGVSANGRDGFGSACRKARVRQDAGCRNGTRRAGEGSRIGKNAACFGASTGSVLTRRGVSQLVEVARFGMSNRNRLELDRRVGMRRNGSSCRPGSVRLRGSID